MCGADTVPIFLSSIVFGSPPRVRGRPRKTLSPRTGKRFTPACAGQTLRRPVVAPAFRFTPACAGQTYEDTEFELRESVHPRVCGADYSGKIYLPNDAGSPPRVRGRRNDHQRKISRPRFTPACAGQTRERVSRFRHWAVHPRVCGADTFRVFGKFNHFGSPPRVRGRPLIATGKYAVRRFTPACAGQTAITLAIVSVSAVHPRVCGADGDHFSNRLSIRGSPPRVRGRLDLFLGISVFRRFTPACAGQTQAFSLFVNRRTVHPRVCGADFSSITGFCSPNGSPPRVRGRRVSSPRPARLRRFTPACAGQTRVRVGTRIARSVHPRVCGADPPPSSERVSRPGSPPRVRGRRHLVPRL